MVLASACPGRIECTKCAAWRTRRNATTHCTARTCVATGWAANAAQRALLPPARCAMCRAGRLPFVALSALWRLKDASQRRPDRQRDGWARAGRQGGKRGCSILKIRSIVPCLESILDPESSPRRRRIGVAGLVRAVPSGPSAVTAPGRDGRYGPTPGPACFPRICCAALVWRLC